MFTQRIPTIPALDVDGLLKLISDPQKASALWEKYKVAQEAYEASKAEIAAAKAEWEKQSMDLATKGAEYVKAVDVLNQAQAEFDNEKNKWLAAKLDWEKKQTEKNAKLSSDAANLAAYKAQLDTAKAEFNAWQKDQQAAWEKSNAQLVEMGDALDTREAAVAEREAKAAELAKLLKAV